MAPLDLAALEKVATRKLKDGSSVHSFRTLLDELSTIVRNTCEARVGQRSGSSFHMTTMPNPAQERAMQLLQSITVSPHARHREMPQLPDLPRNPLHTDQELPFS